MGNMCVTTSGRVYEARVAVGGMLGSAAQRPCISEAGARDVGAGNSGGGAQGRVWGQRVGEQVVADDTGVHGHAAGVRLRC